MVFANRQQGIPIPLKNDQICTKLEIFSSFVHNWIMSTKLETFLNQWPKPYIREQDLQVLFGFSSSKRHDAVKYAISQNILVQIRRGLYLIQPRHPRAPQYDPFELALLIYGPSYISLESALSQHAWIPEAVFVTTSVTSRRGKYFDTPIGLFRYSHTPIASFYLHVEQMKTSTSTFFLAHPWKAIADYLYVYTKSWNSIVDMCGDLRIEENKIREYDIQVLRDLAQHYANEKVKQTLSFFLKELDDENKNY